MADEVISIYKKQESGNKVNHPDHYQGSIECIDALKACLRDLDGFEGFCAGNIIKYVWRYKHKNGTEDLEKAEWYLDCLIKYESELK